MKQVEFESLLFVDVEERAAAERTPREGKPRYLGRPWTQLRDEMVARGAKTIKELPADPSAVFYRSTGSGSGGGVTTLFRGLFGSTPSN